MLVYVRMRQVSATTLRRMLLCAMFFVAVTPRPGIASLECMSIAGAASILRGGAVVLLGEIHGTDQAPEAISALTCHALDRGLNVTVALEIPRDEQEAIERYLTPDDRSEPLMLDSLMKGSFWQRGYQDGRSSRGMLELLRSLRRYREETERVRVVIIDDPQAPEGRDAYMAHRLRDVRAAAEQNLILVLTGNLHNRLVIGTRWNPQYEPMGYLLEKLLGSETELVSLRITHSGRSAWVCTGSAATDCGVRELDGKDDLPMGIELFADSEHAAFSGRLHVGPISASPPAKN